MINGAPGLSRVVIKQVWQPNYRVGNGKDSVTTKPYSLSLMTKIILALFRSSQDVNTLSAHAPYRVHERFILSQTPTVYFGKNIKTDSSTSFWTSHFIDAFQNLTIDIFICIPHFFTITLHVIGQCLLNRLSHILENSFLSLSQRVLTFVTQRL